MKEIEFDTGIPIEQRTGFVPEPFGIFNIELTNRCPMKCVMCPRTRHMTRDQGDMDFGLFQKIIDELTAANPAFENNEPLWLHHFGESLLHPEFHTFIAYASGQQIRTCLSVNPVMLNDDIADRLIASDLFLLYLSLDGHDEDSFRRIRGVRKAYATSVDRVRKFLEKKVASGSTCTIVLSMIDFGLNRDSIEKMRTHWETVPGIDAVLLKHFSTWDGSAEEVTMLVPDPPEMTRPRLSHTVECGFPWEKMTILWDGDVVPCCNDYDKKVVLGNAAREALADIWNGSPMQALRREFITNSVVNPLCRNCDKLRLPRKYWTW